MEKCSNAPSLSDPGLFNDPGLLPHAGVIRSRLDAALALERRIVRENGSLAAFADYHETFGLHFEGGAWVFREWAPNADRMFIVSDRTGWQPDEAFRVDKTDAEIFEARFPADTFSHGDLFRLRVTWPGGEGDRIPTAARRVVQDPDSLIFNAQVWHPDRAFPWKHGKPVPDRAPLLVYETHPGMALEAGRVGTWTDFRRHILPKVVDAGYTAIQLMAVQEHPYYASFGYHVSSFFAPSSRFGTPEELKQLVDAAHGRGIRVLMDVIHSHAVRNETEGLSRFDGTLHQFFHAGDRGIHRLWDSRCFDYGNSRVIRFLLSNLRYWIEEFRIDGFRFDGITSMLFEDHGLGRAFVRYEDYFGPDVDTDALAYLYLANRMAHTIRPDLVTVAEDVSGYPGLAAPTAAGGSGFDFRFAMGIADFWIRLVKDVRDEDWPLGRLWHELTTRRTEEATISYAECHDQALVGDKTLMMHLMGDRIYTAMAKRTAAPETARAVALHKMIRLITLATANAGYLNFMGNEFGHPEWVDFPSERNDFSFHYARRQWSLKYDEELLYRDLAEFDRQMTGLARDRALFDRPDPELMHLHEADKILAFRRGDLYFAFNFHPHRSFTDYGLPAGAGKYRMILDTDEARSGGPARLAAGQIHFTRPDGEGHRLPVYLPSRAGVVLEKLD